MSALVKNEALRLAQDPLEQAIAQNNLALVELEAPAGDTDLAIALLTEALAVRRAHGDLRGVAAAVANLGNLAFARQENVIVVNGAGFDGERPAAVGFDDRLRRIFRVLRTLRQQGRRNSAGRQLRRQTHWASRQRRHVFAANRHACR